MASKRRRPQRSQNFLHNRQLVKELLRQTCFGEDDTILEIGPGRGIITQELLAQARSVIAVEIDPDLCRHLLRRFDQEPGLLLFQADFLSLPLPSTSYSVFANTPFAIEGKAIRKLLDGDNPPQELHLVVRQDVGERWVGCRKESYFSISHKPWFEMAVSHRFKRSDFQPKPKVDAVLISIIQRHPPLLAESERDDYRRFIEQGFGGGRRIDSNLRPFLSASQLKRLSRECQFPYRARPTDLTFDHWLQLFEDWRGESASFLDD